MIHCQNDYRTSNLGMVKLTYTTSKLILKVSSFLWFTNYIFPPTKTPTCKRQNIFHTFLKVFCVDYVNITFMS